MSFVRSAAADEFAAAHQSECAAEGRYGALKTVPAVPAPKKAKIAKKEAVSYQLSAREDRDVSSYRWSRAICLPLGGWG